MEFHKVKSTNIDAIAYEGSTLRVRFRNGSEYAYDNVTETEHVELMEAESKGRWMASFVAKRSGVVRAKKPDVKTRREATATKAEPNTSAATFAGVLMRSQIKRTSRIATFCVTK